MVQIEHTFVWSSIYFLIERIKGERDMLQTAVACGSAFQGDPAVLVIRNWVRQCCKNDPEAWSPLHELRESYEEYCRRHGYDDQTRKHDILPTLKAMGYRVIYGEEPGAYGIQVKPEVKPEAKHGRGK